MRAGGTGVAESQQKRGRQEHKNQQASEEAGVWAAGGKRDMAGRGVAACALLLRKAR